ncbi:hypothetical protein AADR41_26975 [Streptomyces sp. CLV115]|uniref:hypothetical protein n=1 Tax=Streptomyces sp. CLV115 TaxID=3138502 RepID=UPI00313CC16F
MIVPVFLGPGESGDELVTSDAYKTLSKVLGALRAHDTDTSFLLGGSGEVAATEVGSYEVGPVQRIAVKPHRSGGQAVPVPPLWTGASPS